MVPNWDDRLEVQATAYPQGKDKEPLFGSPYKVTLGFPLNSLKLTTQGKVIQQELLMKSIHCDAPTIHIRDLFGSSEYLVMMLNGGIRSSKLAYSLAHLKLLKIQNNNSQVLSLPLYTIYSKL